MGREGWMRQRSVGASWAWAAIGSAVCAAMIPLEPSLLEEGLILHFAERLTRGEHLYRDLVFFSGPLPFELLAALFRIIGHQVSVGRIVIAVLSGASTGVTFAMARRARAGAMAHAAAACLACAPVLLFPLLSTYFHTTLALHLCVLAAYAALRGMVSTRWAASAGILVACVALTKQSIGVAIALGILACVFSQASPDRRIRQCLWLLVGSSVSAMVTLLVFGARGDLGAAVHAMVVMPFSLGESFASGYPNVWPIGELTGEIDRNRLFYVPHLYNILTGQQDEIGAPVVALTQLLFAVPPLAILLPIARRVRSGALPPALWFQQAIVWALFTNLFPRADWGHLVFVLPVAMAQLLSTVGASRSVGNSGTRLAAMSAASAVVVAALAVGSFAAGRELHRMAGPRSFGPRVPQLPVSPAYQDPGVPRVIRFLLDRTQPGEAIFVARAEPLVYFATDTRNPTPYGGVIPGDRERQQRTILAGLQQVRYVVMSEIDQPLFLYYRDELPEVQSYLERFFRVPEEYERNPSWIVALERGEDRGPAAIDLFERRSLARAWTLDAEGVEREIADPLPEMASRQNRRPLPVVLGARGGGLDFAVDVPMNAVFRADLGLTQVRGPNRMRDHARGIRMEVLVGSRLQGSNGRDFQPLYSQRLRMGRSRIGHWTPIEVDLSAFGGRSVTLRLQAIAREPALPGALAWWGSPGIVVKPPAHAAAPTEDRPPARQID